MLEFGVVGFGVTHHQQVGGLGGLADERLGDEGLQGGEADEEVGHGVGWDEWAGEMGQPEMGFGAWDTLNRVSACLLEVEQRLGLCSLAMRWHLSASRRRSIFGFQAAFGVCAMRYRAG